MIGAGVHIYIYVCGQKKFESYFSDRLTFSNIRSRTSRQIYRLALPLLVLTCKCKHTYGIAIKQSTVFLTLDFLVYFLARLLATVKMLYT